MTTPRSGPALAQPFWLPTPSGPLHAVWHAPAGPPRGAVLHLPPFGEEMNAARRQTAHAAQALSIAGWGVLRIDLSCTGESPGEFAEARWDAWLDDARHARRWLMEHLAPRQPIVLWGLRLGAILATELAGDPPLSATSAPPILLLWQPLTSGQAQLRHWQRLGTAAGWLHAPDAADHPPPARAWASGQTVRLAGYDIHPALAHRLAETQLVPPASAAARCEVIEVAAAISPATSALAASFRERGWRCRLHQLAAARFWETVNGDMDPGLSRHTLEALA